MSKLIRYVKEGLLLLLLVQSSPEITPQLCPGVSLSFWVPYNSTTQKGLSCWKQNLLFYSPGDDDIFNGLVIYFGASLGWWVELPQGEQAAFITGRKRTVEWNTDHFWNNTLMVRIIIAIIINKLFWDQKLPLSNTELWDLYILISYSWEHNIHSNIIVHLFRLPLFL